MRLAVLMASLISSMAASSLHAADLIGRVEIQGNLRIDTSVISSAVKLTAGKHYDASLAQASLTALNATGYFANVAIERRGRDVLVTVTENASLAEISFIGNAGIEKALLEPEVKLKLKDPITPSKAHAAALRIRDLYRSKGRVATSVQASLQPLPENRANLVFHIVESEVMTIASLTVVGNQAFTVEKLRDVMASSESSWLDILKTSSTYDAKRLELDRELLLIHYRKNGYPDVKVTFADPIENAAKKGYDVTFTIDEGDRFTFGPSVIDARAKLDGVDLAKLEKLIATTPGDTYNAERVQQSIDRLSAALADGGAVTAQVKSKFQRDVTKHTLAPVYVVAEGPRVSIEKINVRGNTKTKDRVIRRALQEAEGDVVNQVIADRDERRLRRLGLFKSVSFKATPGSAPDKAVLDIEVVEQDTTELSFGAGYSSSEGLVGDVAIADTNLFGNGQTLRLKLSGSQTRFQAEVGFTEPSLFDSRYSGGFDLLYKDSDNTKAASYKDTKAGGDIRLGTSINDNLAVGTNYSYVRNNIYDVGPAASTAIKEAARGGGTYDTSSVGTSVTWDDRNKRTLPTSGSYFTTSQDFAGVGGDARFIRSTAEGRLYYPLSDSVTLVGRAVAGTINGWGGQDVRLLDTFNKGGETVRGFAPGGIGPRDLASANQDSLGGTSYVAASAEARFALPFVPDSVGLKGAVFADSGSLFGVNKTAAALPGLAGAAATPRVSVGAGLIWDSPLGALGVNYGVPLVKQPFDKVQPLSFGLVGY